MTQPTRHAPLMIDIAGTTLSPIDRQRLQHPLVGGLILFARNCQSRAQITALCAAVKALRADLLISIDHEGGRVQRMKTDGFVHLPAMARLGQFWMHQDLKATNIASACGFILASQLRACGVDFSFTPVLDLDYGNSSVIGDRALHSDARVVTMLAKSLMHGLLRAGMGNCGKHFPGHGHVATDSHTEVPVDKRALKDILSRDALPFEHLSSTLLGVMPAHVIYPQVDTRPAGYSTLWLQTILRQQMGFAGAIFSDDLSMEGGRYLNGRRLSHCEAAVAALQAGCDMVLLCNQSQANDARTLDALIADLDQALQRGQWQANAHSEARRLALVPPPYSHTWEQLHSSPAWQQARDLLAQLDASA